VKGMTKTAIAWCDFTWNPVWGCLHGCSFCYARGIAKRFGMQVAGRDDFYPTWLRANFDRQMPKHPARIFVNSMSDPVFWKPEWAAAIRERMAQHPEHLFLILTKGRQPNDWRAANVLFGSTAIDQAALTAMPADRNFVSIEPIFGPVDLAAMPADLQWVIVGAETGNRKARVVPDAEWIAQLRRQCKEFGIPLFEKDSLQPIAGRLVREYPSWPSGR